MKRHTAAISLAALTLATPATASTVITVRNAVGVAMAKITGTSLWERPNAVTTYCNTSYSTCWWSAYTSPIGVHINKGRAQISGGGRGEGRTGRITIVAGAHICVVYPHYNTYAARCN